MFPYDSILRTAASRPVQDIAEVIETMEAIDATCVEGDGLKWFNWLYLQVTRAVDARVQASAFHETAWIAELDVQFARLYFEALASALTDGAAPECWQALFNNRDRTATARIQFALAGINAHINHDLPEAIFATCLATATAPDSTSTHYRDYTSLNPTLDSLIESAKRELHFRLLGDALPAISHLEEIIAAWSVSAAREGAWRNAGLLWHVRDAPPLFTSFLETLDGLSTVAGKALLAPAP
jgi:hypothetical protein